LPEVNAAARAPGYRRRMIETSFRCPTTGLRVQVWTNAADGDADDLYEAVTCTACQRMHLINIKSGRVLGRPDEGEA
jgi:hypothetical protein